MRISDWSSDVCSSDLYLWEKQLVPHAAGASVEVVDPNFVQSVFALPWGGTSLPIYFERDARVRSCSSYVAFYDNDVMKMVHALGQKWEAEYQHLPKEEQDAVLGSEEHTSELQSLMRISYAVFF